MKSLEAIVAIEKEAQTLVVQAQQQARDMQIQAEKDCQVITQALIVKEKELDAELAAAQEEKRTALEKKMQEKVEERLGQLHTQIKKNQNKTKKLFFELMR